MRPYAYDCKNSFSSCIAFLPLPWSGPVVSVSACKTVGGGHEGGALELEILENEPGGSWPSRHTSLLTKCCNTWVNVLFKSFYTTVCLLMLCTLYSLYIIVCFHMLLGNLFDVIKLIWCNIWQECLKLVLIWYRRHHKYKEHHRLFQHRPEN